MSHNNYHGNVNPDLLSIIPKEAHRIVEVGCSSGQFLNALRSQNPDRNLLGFEMMENEGLKARKIGLDVVIGNIENLNVAEELSQRGWVEDNKPDCVIFGDVLEHLYDPWKLLTDLRPLLKKGGYLAICIPNVKHWSVMQELMNGQFRYQDSGVLDRTHIRFFTRITAVKLIADAKYDILTMRRRKILNAGSKDFLKKAEPFITEEYERLDFLTLQYVFLARVS